ncbi:MAG: oligosaccharide flippase family protein [Candidatus Hydrogenedentota bacterium]
MGSSEHRFPVFKNIIYNTIAQFSTRIISFVFFPVIVLAMGHEKFGLWALIFSIIGYLPLLEFGINSAVVKYIAEFPQKISEMVSQTIIVLFFIILPFCFFLVLFSNEIVNLLNIKSEYISQSVILLRFGILLFFIQIVLSPLDGALVGLERLGQAFKISAVSEMVKTMLCAGMVLSGFGLIEIMVMYILVTAGFKLLAYRTIKKIIPAFKFGFYKVDINLIKKLYTYGLNSFVINLSTIITDYTDKILLQFFTGNLAYITYYEIGRKAIQIAYAILKSITSAVVPAISRWNKENSIDVIIRFLKSGSRFIGVIMIPVLLFIMIYPVNILRLWVGFELALRSATCVSAFMYGLIPYALMIPLTTIMFGRAEHYIIARWCILLVIINIGLDVILIPLFSYTGCAIAYSTSQLIANAGIFFSYIKKVKFITLEIAVFLKVIIINSILFFIFLFLKNSISIIYIGLIYLFLLIFGGMLLNLFRKDDLNLLKHILRL